MKPNITALCALELSNLIIYEWYYERMRTYVEEKKLDVHLIDTDSFIFSSKQTESLFEDLKPFKGISILAFLVYLMNYN